LPITAILLDMRDKSANSDGEYLYSCPCTNTYSTRIHHVQICLVHVVLIRSVGISTLNTLQQGPLKDRRASSWEQQDIRFTVSCMGDTEHRKIHLLGGYISAIAIHAWQNKILRIRIVLPMIWFDQFSTHFTKFAKFTIFSQSCNQSQPINRLYVLLANLLWLTFLRSLLCDAIL